MKVPRNIYGEPITKQGTVDRRKDNAGRQPFEPTHAYDVVEREGDERRYHVIQHNLASGLRIRVSRHKKRWIAEKTAERLRLLEPDRRPTRKQKHKAGIRT